MMRSPKRKNRRLTKPLLLLTSLLLAPLALHAGAATKQKPNVVFIPVAEWANETPGGWKDVLPLVSSRNAAKAD